MAKNQPLSPANGVCLRRCSGSCAGNLSFLPRRCCQIIFMVLETPTYRHIATMRTSMESGVKGKNERKPHQSPTSGSNRTRRYRGGGERLDKGDPTETFWPGNRPIAPPECFIRFIQRKRAAKVEVSSSSQSLCRRRRNTPSGEPFDQRQHFEGAKVSHHPSGQGRHCCIHHSVCSLIADSRRSKTHLDVYPAKILD